MSYLCILVLLSIHLLCANAKDLLGNIALGKPTLQSSLYTSRYTSDRAVDGVLEHDTYLKPCTHTKEQQNPWWTVDLQQTFSIHSLTIFNRGTYRCDGYKLCNNRLIGFRVYISDNVTVSRFEKLCYQSEDTSLGLVLDVRCTSPTSGRFVTASLPSVNGERDILELCEVEVFGDVVPPVPFTNLPDVTSARSCSLNIRINPTGFVKEQILWSVSAFSRSMCARKCCDSEQKCSYVNFRKSTKTCNGYTKVDDSNVTDHQEWEIWHVL